MALKATKITPENVDMLASRYGVEDVEDVLPLGFYLVAEFGVDEHFDVLTPSNYELLFTEIGEIRNGFVAVEAR